MSNDSVSLSDLASGPAVKFEKIGSHVVGRIVRASRQQQRDFDTGKAMTWEDGSPRMQTVIALNVAGEELSLYCKGGKFEAVEGEGQSLEMAIATAVRAAGCSSIDPGAELAVAHTGLGKPPRSGAFAPKLFTAQYRPAAAPSVALGDLFSDAS